MIVLATGVFDILHVGHLLFLEKAKELGDNLVVLVSCDDICGMEKGRPVNSQKDRCALVKALKPVDDAFIGAGCDKYEDIMRIRPDVLALGYDQKYDPVVIEEDLSSRGLKCRVVRLQRCGDISTTKIVNCIMARG